MRKKRICSLKSPFVFFIILMFHEFYLEAGGWGIGGFGHCLMVFGHWHSSISTVLQLAKNIMHNASIERIMDFVMVNSFLEVENGFIKDG